MYYIYMLWSSPSGLSEIWPYSGGGGGGGGGVGREGGHDSLGMKEWSDWPYILF